MSSMNRRSLSSMNRRFVKYESDPLVTSMNIHPRSRVSTCLVNKDDPRTETQEGFITRWLKASTALVLVGARVNWHDHTGFVAISERNNRTRKSCSVTRQATTVVVSVFSMVFTHDRQSVSKRRRLKFHTCYSSKELLLVPPVIASWSALRSVHVRDGVRHG